MILRRGENMRDTVDLKHNTIISHVDATPLTSIPKQPGYDASRNQRCVVA
jgi:hypothetical protein